jgi:glyoxylase-like metal-dependent hydrolase (beta-lactamase superfamily II)
MATVNRREVLEAAIGGCAATVVPCAALAQAGRSALAVDRLRGNIVQLRGVGGNVVVASGSDGIVMVDSGLAQFSTELLDAVLGEAREQRVQALFNTHWHSDHTGGNDAFGKAGTKIVAHVDTKLWLGGDFYVEWEDRHYEPRSVEALPTETFYTGGTLTFGAERIEYGHLPLAHTDGDVYVFFPQSNVLVAGDTLFVDEYPILDYSTGGWIGGLIDANRALLDLADSDTLIVPGRGPVQRRAHLQTQHDMLAAVMEPIVQMMVKGLSAKEMVARSVTGAFDAKWGDPSVFVANVYRGLWARHHRLGVRILG